MPELPAAAFIRAIEVLVGQDHAWVPTAREQSLYLRPFMIATQPYLGLSHPSLAFLFVLIASPAGEYFGGGLRPVSVWLARDYTRAAIGGTGAVKAGGNYGGGFVVQQQAHENGCDQVVWLDAAEHRWVEEMGGMNLFFVYGSGASARITTPALTGTLLPGITRDSLLRIAPDLGIGASEGRISVDDWQSGCESGRDHRGVRVRHRGRITPVGLVKGAAGSFTIGDGVTPGPVTMRLRKQLLGIQFGEIPDPYGWIHKIR